jgi:hypothetical protein
MIDRSELTKEERNAVRCLEQLAKRWPESLELFAWAGTLVVLRVPDGEEPAHKHSMTERVVARILGIRCDGGDP